MSFTSRNTPPPEDKPTGLDVVRELRERGQELIRESHARGQEALDADARRQRS